MEPSCDLSPRNACVCQRFAKRELSIGNAARLLGVVFARSTKAAAWGTRVPYNGRGARQVCSGTK